MFCWSHNLIAFVTFIKTFGIWIYLLCGLGILFGIKMLYDHTQFVAAQRSLPWIRNAVEQSQRGVLLIAIMAVIVFFVTAVSVIIAPFMPQPEPLIARGVTPTIANIFPTAAATLTASPSVPQPTETIFVTGTPPPPPAAASNTPPPVVIRPTQTLSSTSNLLAAPKLVYERNKDPVFDNVVVTGDGEATTRNRLIFKWDWVCDQCVLGPNDKFVITISFIDKLSGLPKSFGGSTTQQKTLTMYEILRSYNDPGQFYQKAKNDMYTWNVQVKRTPGDQPVSAVSETWKFTWH
jgi:hypothetical protein